MESGNVDGFEEVEFGPADSLEKVQEGETGPAGEIEDVAADDEINVLEQLDTLDAVQELVDSAEDAINLSETSVLILKTNISPR